MGRGLRHLSIIGGVIALAVPTSALAGALTLHPSGFGEKSYAAWKAHEGQADSKGNDNQSLYFEKRSSTFANAAGVALFKGFRGLTLGQITGLEWEHRNDGHCGAGAPRWTFVSRNATGQRFVTHLGCAAAVHTPGGTSTDRNGVTQTWTRDTYNNGAMGQPCVLLEPPYPTVTSCDAFEIVFFGIIFDEGFEHGRCAGVASTISGRSCVHLDNIKVEADGVPHCWTSANDNGNASTVCTAIPATTSTTATVFSTLDAVPVGTAVDPTDLELVDSLTEAYPDVALTSWSLYPSVY